MDSTSVGLLILQDGEQFFEPFVALLPVLPVSGQVHRRLAEGLGSADVQRRPLASASRARIGLVSASSAVWTAVELIGRESPAHAAASRRSPTMSASSDHSPSG